MKKRYFYIIMVFIFTSCSNNDDGLRDNPFLPNFEFNTGNLINTAGGNNYSAFELSDPNHALNNCSPLTVEGIIATSSCDNGNSYDILTGLGREGSTGEYALKRYFTEVSGNIIRVFNN